MLALKLSDLGSTPLEATRGAPELLYLMGNRELPKLHCVAIVGTRRPSPFGLAASYRFGAQLAKQGFCVVSGLARGIDGAAHRGALSVGGHTIAVLGHGLDRIYPAIHRGLAQEILQKRGCLISEYPVGTPPLPHHFPARNRIVSGLSVGVIVIEASEKSGSLITARCAADQGREVYVIPGRFDDSLYRGSHSLIQQGARLILEPQEVLADLAPMMGLSSVQIREWNESDQQWADFFRRQDFVATVEKIQSHFGWDFSRIYQEIEQARARGLLIESQPQQYVWVGN